MSAALGVVYGLNDNLDGGRPQLLTNAGFLLDILGEQPLIRKLFLQFRTSLAGNDPQLLTSQSGSSSDNPTVVDPDQDGPDLTTFIENARRLALGMSVAWYPYDHARVQLGAVVETELAWNLFEPFVFPSVRVDLGGNPPADTVVRLVDLYPPERISEVRRRVDRVLPALTGLVGPTAVFSSNSGLALYATFRIGKSERLTRQVTFEDTTLTPAPTTLRDATTSQFHWIWRAGLGMTLGSAVDLRADAFGPMGSREEVDPVVRIYLSKEFDLRR